MMSAIVASNTNLEELVHWQRGPMERGGFQIVWSCVALIITCTWTALHLNVPASGNGFWEKTLRKLKWMLITIIFPELVLAHAMIELTAAVDDFMKMSKREHDFLRTKWCVHPSKQVLLLHKLLSGSWMSLLYTSRPKATAIQNDEEAAHTQAQHNIDAEESLNEKHKNCEVLSFQRWTLSHNYLANMGGLKVNGNITTGLCLVKALENGKIFELMENIRLSKDDIMDKSKADNLVRLLWLWQMLRLLVELIIRLVQHLPITQLEVITASFCVITLITVVVQISKPQSIDQSIHVFVEPKHSFTEIQHGHFTQIQQDYDMDWTSQGQNILSLFTFYFGAGPFKLHIFPVPLTGTNEKKFRIRNDDFRGLNSVTLPRMTAPSKIFSVSLGLATIVFRLIHCTAWNFQFPTVAEKWIWRGCAIAGVVLPGIVLFTSFLPTQLFREITHKKKDYEIEVFQVAQLMTENLKLAFVNEVLHGKDGSPLFSRAFFDKWSEVLNGNDKSRFRKQCIMLKEKRRKLSELNYWLLVLDGFYSIIQVLNFLIYLLTRLAIMVTAVASFRLAPRGIYKDTWAGLLPTIQ